jgi:hypothetical protein
MAKLESSPHATGQLSAVLYKTASKLELWWIQNPTAVLNPDEQVEVGYIITDQQILNMATQTN